MTATAIQQATARLQRSELAVPGSNPSFFEKAANSAADVVFLDVEDAVAPDEKEAARRNIVAAVHLADHLPEAPVHLFVAGWKRRGEPQLQALFPAIQNVLLACRAVGLGASLTTLHRSFGEELDAKLGLPDNCPTAALIPIGWPLGRYGRPPRRSIDECLWFDRYQGKDAR